MKLLFWVTARSCSFKDQPFTGLRYYRLYFLYLTLMNNILLYFRENYLPVFKTDCYLTRILLYIAISAVILPTLNLYVTTLTDVPFYLGLVLASFSLSGLLVAPIFGICHDKLHKTKVMLLVANCFEIVGKLVQKRNI